MPSFTPGKLVLTGISTAAVTLKLLSELVGFTGSVLIRRACLFLSASFYEIAARGKRCGLAVSLRANLLHGIEQYVFGFILQLPDAFRT